MPLLFENVGHGMSDLKVMDQEDCKDTYNFVWEFCKRAENNPVYIQQDIKDVYLCGKEESMTSHQLNIKDLKTIALKSLVSDFTRYQPTMVALDPEYANTCINVKKNTFVKIFSHTWA